MFCRPQHRPRWRFACLLIVATTPSGCQQSLIDSADSIASRVIRQRQQEALGATSDFGIGDEDGTVGSTANAYSFVPHPVDPAVPESLRASATAPKEDALQDTGSNGTGSATPLAEPQSFSLSDALGAAFRHARDFQTQKEELYLSALTLMTERHLWTPQLAGSLSLEYTNDGQITGFDQAMTAVAELSASQRLPYGGEVAARIVNTLVRDLRSHATAGESGTAILEASIPLLRGAGRVAYESRFQAERNLIYAVRDFEAARRDLVVDVSGDFFSLLATKARIASAGDALDNAEYDLRRGEAFVAVGDILQVEADRARIQVLSTRNSLISAQAQYQAELDRFKVRLGLDISENIDAVEEGLALAEPSATESEAVAAALQYRLDLLNSLDAIDDARRAVKIAQNNFLPQFDFTGAVTFNTDPDRPNTAAYNTERTTWQGMLELEVPLDRRAERNTFRAALIELRQAERNLEVARDLVWLDVRDARRNLELARTSMDIQRESIRVNEQREEILRNQFKRGEISSNRDVVEAQQSLQQSRNEYARRLADYRLVILVLLRDTGTLRVDDNGHWIR